MPGKSIYNKAQWLWAADRVDEGYYIQDVADFLGVNRWTLARHMADLGRKPHLRADLPSLNDRKKEFLALGGENSENR